MAVANPTRSQATNSHNSSIKHYNSALMPDKKMARVYPEMVIHGTDGKVESVRYLELTALLLNELQKQTAKVTAQQREIDALKQQNTSINALSERLAVLEQQARTTTPQGLRSLASK